MNSLPGLLGYAFSPIRAVGHMTGLSNVFGAAVEDTFHNSAGRKAEQQKGGFFASISKFFSDLGQAFVSIFKSKPRTGEEADSGSWLSWLLGGSAAVGAATVWRKELGGFLEHLGIPGSELLKGVSHAPPPPAAGVGLGGMLFNKYTGTAAVGAGLLGAAYHFGPPLIEKMTSALSKCFEDATEKGVNKLKAAGKEVGEQIENKSKTLIQQTSQEMETKGRVLITEMNEQLQTSGTNILEDADRTLTNRMASMERATIGWNGRLQMPKLIHTQNAKNQIIFISKRKEQFMQNELKKLKTLIEHAEQAIQSKAPDAQHKLQLAEHSLSTIRIYEKTQLEKVNTQYENAKKLLEEEKDLEQKECIKEEIEEIEKIITSPQTSRKEITNYHEKIKELKAKQLAA